MADPIEPQMPTELAFAAVLPEINAIADDDGLPVNVDVVNAVTLVLGVVPELRALRPEITRQLPLFDIGRFDKLEQYALALNHANTLHRSTLPNKASIAELGAEIAGVRDRLLQDALSLAGYGLVNAERLKDCKKQNGYRAAATDVFNIVAVLKEHWSRIENKTPVTMAALNEAGNRAVELLAAVGVRDQAPVSTGEASRLKQKIFKLFVEAYDDARRAVAYLRYKQGDADDIAPSLWAQQGARRRAEQGELTKEDLQKPLHPADAASEATVDGEIPMDNAAGLPVTNPFTDN